VSFWVLDLESGPPRLRGAISRWAVEVRAGLYVGSTSAKTRDAIWALVEREVRTASRAVLVFPSSRHVMGFEARSIGRGRRVIADVDGLVLARFLPSDERECRDADEPERLGAGSDAGREVVEATVEFERIERKREDD
jgi:CRISPR-associated protein Cas2